MTGVVLAFVAGLLVAGVPGVVACCRCRTRWLLRGQRQAELCHGGWVPAVSGEEHNRPDRRRSPDHQLVQRVPDPPAYRSALYHR